ncbi:MAG: hypothetical protein HFJ33_04510 [Clostridia bacterium]|nr:hypothetical protein [Clostridia bacterium]
MNKLILTLLAIIITIGAVFTAVMIFQPKQEEKVESQRVNVAEQEEILDDCTDEYDGMEIENTVKANTQQEKTSPNCSLVTKTYFSDCGHIKSEYTNLPQDMVNLTKEEIQNKFSDCKVESFASHEVVLYQVKSGECGEHYLVKDKEGKVVIYEMLEDGKEREMEITGITTEYLPETDKINMKNGIKVNGKQNLNQLIEDFE